jgi:hypothetical protein
MDVNDNTKNCTKNDCSDETGFFCKEAATAFSAKWYRIHLASILTG